MVLCGSACKDFAFCENGQMFDGPSGATTTGLTCGEGKVFDTTIEKCQYISSTCPVPWKFKGNKSLHFSLIEITQTVEFQPNPAKHETI